MIASSNLRVLVCGDGAGANIALRFAAQVHFIAHHCHHHHDYDHHLNHRHLHRHHGHNHHLQHPSRVHGVFLVNPSAGKTTAKDNWSTVKNMVVVIFIFQ